MYQINKFAYDLELISCMYCVSLLLYHIFTDPRTKPWLLSGTPGPLFTILGTYLYFCLYAGPKYMKDRKPFELKKTLIIYNIVQVVLSVVLVVEVSFSSHTRAHTHMNPIKLIYLDIFDQS